MTDQNQTEQNVPTTSQPISAAVPAGTTVKDFLIPLSIIIAGIFVGAGLYFGGGGGLVTYQMGVAHGQRSSLISPLGISSLILPTQEAWGDQ